MLSYLIFGLIILCFPSISLSQSQRFLQISQDSNHSGNDNSETNLPISQGFIPGIWRGFHEAEDLTVYYGYQFRKDGSFWARHRVYQAQETVYNKIWEGQWELEGNILTVKGFNRNDSTESLTIQFQLTKDFKFNFQQGSLSDVYKSMKLNKITSIN